MTKVGALAWRRYFEDLKKRSPAVTYVLGRQRHLFVVETDWVIGNDAQSGVLARLGVLEPA